MHITKVLETSVDLFDPVDIYTPDIEAVLRRELEKRYKNRCYQSILILEISKLIRYSTVNMVDNRLDGAAYVDVQFEISGVIFVQGEILHNCKIIEIHTNAITAEHQYAGIKLQKDTGNVIFKILKTNQKIPVIVQKVRYMPNQKTVSMIATPYIPQIQDEVYYNITAPLNPKETEQLNYIMNEIKSEEELHKKILKEKSYDFFKDILYPYKVNQKYEQSKKAMTYKLKPVPLELKSMLEINSGIICYPSEDNKYNKRLFWNSSGDVSNIDSKALIVDSDLYAVLAEISNKYLLYMQALRGFVETYPTAESVQELLIYWKLCKNAQI